MLLAVDVVGVGILAIVRLLADGAGFLERRLGGGCGGGGLVREDLLGEDLRGERGQGSDSALEVVAVPVGLHVRPLQLAGAKCDLACVAGEGVGGLDVGLGGHLLGRHGAGLWEYRVKGESMSERALVVAEGKWKNN